jgi:hypothetical protein
MRQGRPKYVDFLDCTGGGDVDTSTRATPDADGCVTALSGRKIKLPAPWAEEAAEVRLGCVRLFDVTREAARSQRPRFRRSATTPTRRLSRGASVPTMSVCAYVAPPFAAAPPLGARPGEA